ncbi:BamA/TamA family outer membrane protein [Chitinophagaceae bacterium 26-R-25]|nr:BamA/TamA family outer membrane protein [Chitinophagaceae bacterium 26-R-25]
MTKNLLITLTFIICGVFSANVFAQDTSIIRQFKPTIDTSREAVPEKDLIDVMHSLRKNKPAKVVDTTIQPQKFLYSVVPAVGYTLSSGWTAILSANVATYLSDPKTTNISSLTVSANYTQYSQLTLPVFLTVWTKDNKWNISADWRFYKYPQDTYGLGGHSQIENADNIDYYHLRLHQSVQKRITSSLYLGLGYFLDYHWDIDEKGYNKDVAEYGLPAKTLASGPVATILFDSRKNSINPSQGFFANVVYRPNLTIFGSDNNWQSLTIDVRKYINFPKGSKNVLAFWNLDWLTPSGKPPYLDLPSTGWDSFNNTGRGYIQGRYRSYNMLYLESEYRFQISRNGLFGGVVFANAQSFSNGPGLHFDNAAPAAGLGLRIKVNKISKANIAIDYGFGLNGSRGLFVNLGEIF